MDWSWTTSMWKWSPCSPSGMFIPALLMMVTFSHPSLMHKVHLACSVVHTDLLKTFSSVCKVSIKLNTPLPASVASFSPRESQDGL
ncbi:hypothetical protein SKAU_G00094660 [Synaphobranchus kaupii]|uniref:Uncharacterized protein n=1 Tax=Synaphobranchus kaupii TaxID=118154 RepID=A0A9Q1J6U9_SYNKA|nr:hypothetical protein SKAU_G00094660 [Synaphobranchus kaupii]